MPELTRIEARIYDSDYIITGEASEEYIGKVASYVDFRMKELSKVFPQASSIKLAILAAVNISDELFQIKNSNTSLQNPELPPQVEERTRKLIDLIDKSLTGE